MSAIESSDGAKSLAGSFCGGGISVRSDGRAHRQPEMLNDGGAVDALFTGQEYLSRSFPQPDDQSEDPKSMSSKSYM
ncbi:hypothetical protein PanWU01x14_216110 [Parasponia andersonii]|uniref:Uncharacterized protein n=1 Tax=Parasponia andersonii TaxID=3476 RepID=A0A2P5BRU5_PARAD|nr:hypothetical protein PanWU01x14_216110 [Parasponia andersonii]